MREEHGARGLTLLLVPETTELISGVPGTESGVAGTEGALAVPSPVSVVACTLNW